MVKLTKTLKVTSLLLALALALSMSGLAFAAPSLQEGENQTGGVEQDSEQNTNQDEPDVNQDSNQPQSQSQQSTQQQGNQQPGQQDEFQQSTAACAQQYTVQAGDSLSLIAQQFFNDVQSYNRIVEATNTASSGNNSFSTIDDPSVIQVGQTLCIPAQAGQQQANLQQNQQQAQQTGQQQAGVQQDAALSVPQGMSKVIFENLSSTDLIVDVSEGPTAQSVWVEPGTREQFVVEPGEYVIMGHEPGGDFGVAPNRVQLTSGELVGLVCNDTGQCQMQQGAQEISTLRNQDQNTNQGTMQQSGQQQGTMQQQNQSGTPQQQDESGTMQQQNQSGMNQPNQQNDDQGQNDQ